jgi:hypothetical protein
VLSLLPDKQGALARAHRALGRGGRIAVSDVIVEQPLPVPLREFAAWSTCVAGALSTTGYVRLFHESGFADVQTICLDEGLVAILPSST